MPLQAQVLTLVSTQIASWSLPNKNFADLENVITKTYQFDGFSIKAQLNPARMISTAAKIDAKTLAARPCFLCAANRPEQQEGIAWRNYDILINPFPIFPNHLTIPTREHTPQSIANRLDDMLSLAAELPDFAVFYNGPKAGASAPDHHHFQAAPKEYFPLVDDTRHFIASSCESVLVIEKQRYLRSLIIIRSAEKSEVETLFDEYKKKAQTSEEEPMMNLVCVYEDNKYVLMILPRAAYRPWQHSAEGEAQLLISPGTVEMSGLFICPVKEHFERLSKEDITDILNQVSR